MTRFYKYFLIFALLFFSMAAPRVYAAGFSWELLNREGKGYVPVDNIRAFYGFTAPERKDGEWHVIENKVTQIKLRPRSQEMRMNSLLFILSHPVLRDSDGRLLVSKTDIIKILDPILRPSYIKSAGSFKTVVLDAGHGGHDAGATNGFAREADLNLKLARILKKNLERKGFNIILTRDSDHFLTLQQRVDIANRYRNALFISLHFNSGSRAAFGIETFTLTPCGTSSTFKGSRSSDGNMLQGNARDSANIALATAVQGTVQRKLGTIDRGVKRARFSVLCGIQHPAILFEGGFMTHARESVLINNDAYLNKMAALLSEAVTKYQRVVVGKCDG